jgi:protein TonB
MAGVGAGAPGAGDGVFMVSLADSQLADSLGDGAEAGKAVTEEPVTDETVTEETTAEEAEEPVAEEAVTEEPARPDEIVFSAPEKPKVPQTTPKPLVNKPKAAENKPGESRPKVAAGQGDAGQGDAGQGDGVGPGAGSAGAGPKGGGGGGGGGDAAGYLKGNFEYIKRRIRQYLVYSPQAKRMGIQGTVTVSFIIEKDGRARNAAVVGSSGHEGLDESALRAVRNASPFPPPPDTARIVVPISFSLK